MSTIAAPPNPCLLAILLVVQARTGSGSQIVFHYPPDPLSDNLPELQRVRGEGPGSSSDSEEDSSSEDDDIKIFTKLKRNPPVHRRDDRSNLSEDDEDYPTRNEATADEKAWKPDWEPLLGFGEDSLVSLLAPGRAWHKRKFELGINDLTLLGRPVYARDDGFWKKRKHRKATRQDDSVFQNEATETTASDSEHNSDGEKPEARTAASSNRTGNKTSLKSQLTMFHVVFVMEPPLLEHTLRVKEMYDNIVKKLSKVLKWEQAQHDYVWKQSDLMASIKSHHLSKCSAPIAMYSETLKRSSLAAALATIYETISSSRIAAVTLSPKVSISFQIPPLTSTSRLPSLVDPPIQPGLWLTTANDSPLTTSDLDSISATSTIQLAKTFTLLLRSSPAKILRDFQSGTGPSALYLANFIEKAKPTKSFYKISIATQLPPVDIQLLARHLIYWRRAVAIPPLHQRDTYIVSPNADMSKLVEACKSFESTFPMMPTLPKILNLLSGIPTPFGSLIPSADHKEEYYKVLAWLMRGGWVTQLRTFAFVRVDPSIKKTIREKERDEKWRRTQSHVENISVQKERDGYREKDKEDDNFAPGSLASVSSSLKRPSLLSRPSSDGGATTATATSASTNPNTTNTNTTSQSNSNFVHNPNHASLLFSPLRATPLEARWLEQIAQNLVHPSQKDNQTQSVSEHLAPKHSSVSNFNSEQLDMDPELQMYFPIFLKYFNGTEALEKIAVREGLKRKFVWDVLGKIGVKMEGGVIENEAEDNAVDPAGVPDGTSLQDGTGSTRMRCGARVVTIRHW